MDAGLGKEVDPVTVRDRIVTSRGNFSQNGTIQVIDSVDNQVLANSFKSHPVRVFEDGVSPSQPEAKCDWARGGCAGAKSHCSNPPSHRTPCGCAG